MSAMIILYLCCSIVDDPDDLLNPNFHPISDPAWELEVISGLPSGHV